MSTPVTAEQFLDAVARSGLLSPEQLRPYYRYEPDDPGTEAHRALAARLVKDRLLTPFQARQLLAGKYRGFFLADKFKILSLLGTGGMGHVFLCEHLLLQRLVAVKALQKAAGDGSQGGLSAALERFTREARAVAALDHPNIARVFDMDRSGAVPFMVMEYVDGTNLHHLVTQASGPLAVDRAAGYIRQAAAGLQHAHENGLVHRDVKPGNLLLDRSGTIKILDLGLARFLRDVSRNENLTARYDDDKTVVGTADYMSPEQALNSSRVDIRADIYSLGATFYFLLTGRAPFEGESVTQKLIGHQMKEPVAVTAVRPEIPPGLAAVVAKMMAKNPLDRYQTPAGVVDALAPWTGGPLPPPPPNEMPKFPPSAYLLGLSPGPPGGSSIRGPLSATRMVMPQAPDETADPDADTPQATGSRTARGRSGPRTGGSRTGGPKTGGPRSLVGRPPKSTAALPPQSGIRPPGSGGHPPEDGGDLPPQPASAARAETVVSRTMPALIGVAAGLLVLVGAAAWWWWSSTTRPGSVVINRPPNFNSNPAPGPGPIPQPQQQPAPVQTPAQPSGVVLTGSGSTFIKPAMDRWAEVYDQQAGTRINYAGIGSGRGVDNMIDRVQEFGCTDAAMTDAQLKKAKQTGGDVVHVPLALGAVVATYNLPDVSQPLRFTGPVLADVFLGKIKKWDDEAIAACNPGVALPPDEIAVVHRGDSSGTTFIWTDFLSKASGEWKAKVGTGTTVKWPVGEDADKNPGVAKAVSGRVGAIGYVELSFALERNLKFAKVQNQAGNYVAPTLESVTAAADAALQSIPADLRFTLTDAPGADSYPIAGASWAVLYVNQHGRAGKELVKFLRWATHDGQSYLKALRYSPLPPALADRIDAKLAEVKIGE